jgi:hypothetical protein
LTESAVDALRHVDVVAGCASAAILALLGFDRNGLGRTNGFAEFAGNASFFAGRVAAEGVFTAEAGADGAFFEGVVDRVPVTRQIGRYCGSSLDLRRPEELLKQHPHPAHHLGE